MRCWNCKYWKRRDKFNGWCMHGENIFSRIIGAVMPSFVFRSAASSHLCEHHTPDMKGGH